MPQHQGDGSSTAHLSIRGIGIAGRSNADGRGMNYVPLEFRQRQVHRDFAMYQRMTVMRFVSTGPPVSRRRK
jgi:hypothetical protein